MKFSLSTPIIRSELSTIPAGEDVSTFVRALASKHGISAEETQSDRLAYVITRISGDEVELDETERLLVALCKKDIISDVFMTSALGKYFRELKRV